MDRRAVGSWLGGPSAAARAAGVPVGRPGERLGLPPEGPGSIATFGRRLVAVLLDWVACLFATRVLAPEAVYGSPGYGFAVLATFFVEVTVLTALGGASFGQRLCGIRVVRLDGAPVPPWWVLVRTALLCLAVPALVWDRDGRGLHDRLAGTVAVRTR